MDLSFFTNSTKEDNVFSLDINDVISRDGGIDGAKVGQEIALINKLLPETKRIDILLNTEGGSITEGVKIASAIVTSEIKTRTINMGYAASMGGVIAIVADERKGVDFGIWMIHNPRAGGVDLSQIEDAKDKEILSKMKEQLMQLIINRTGIDKDKLTALMDNETWMNFEEAKALNFVDGEPIRFGKRPKVKMAAEMSVFENIKKINEFHCSLEQTNINNNKKENHMEDLKKQFEARIEEKDLKIEEFENKIANYTSEIDTLKSDYQNLVTEKDALSEKIEAQAAEIQGFKDVEIVSFVENAIEEGKLNKDNKDSLIEQAKENFEGFKAIVDAITPKEKEIEGKDKPKISELLELAAAKAGIEGKEDLGGLTRFEWLSKNDDKKLAAIKENEPELYKALTDEFINSKNSK